MARAAASILVVAIVLAALFKTLRSKPKFAAPAADQTESQAAESSSTDQSGYEYEVFLSFRGSDTRRGFTNFLYNALKDAGIRTFLDDEELRTGEGIGDNLIRAIEQSKISIPVFSKNYASSKWCLMELNFMLECKNRPNHTMKILPVFYDVEPRDVRHQTGSYARAFQLHAKKYKPEMVQQWREALAEVGALKGWDLQEAAQGHQGELIKLIVTKVLSELKKAQLIVPDTLVGIDDRVKEIAGLLDLGASDVRILGIWGMGGIGKTTLAKVIYNQILDDFERCSFLNDIRETSQRNGLPYLQSLLVADLSRRECQPFRNVDQGMNDLKERYRDKKVLILLDDIDETNQLDALLIRLDSFGRGSRIIVTTRNKDVLDDRVGWIYEVKEMNAGEALKLFCKHAFRTDTPKVELSVLSIQIAETTGGLPLALEVIGSYLSRKEKPIWEETLVKLKDVPNEKVQDKLRISYESLDYGQKQIFLDIACLFIGEDVNDPFYMWEDCKFYPKSGTDLLIALSLIKIGDGDKIWMHDQLRDLGREIVRRESVEEFGERSRLWCSEEAVDVIQSCKGTPKVKAIRYECEDKELRSLKSEQFRSLPNLRFLDLGSTFNGVTLAGDFGNHLSSLRWLRWRGTSSDSFTINMQNLVFLDIQLSDAADDWKGWSPIKMMKLRVLILGGFHRPKRAPDFSAFPNLERLTLQRFTRLEVIGPSIGILKKLSYLKIQRCPRVEKLPDQLGYLGKLEILNANGCRSLTEIPSSIGDATSLSHLVLDHSPIKQLPDSISDLPGLQLLSLRGARIRSIPETIGKLSPVLKVLDLSFTSIRSLAVNVGTLFYLETLKLNDCEFLETIPALPGSSSDHQQQVGRVLPKLMELDISECKMLKDLANLSGLKLLRHLDAGGSVELRGLKGLDELKVLEILTVSGWFTELPSLSNLKLLRYLEIRHCEKLQQLSFLDESNALEKLAVVGCKAITRLPNLSGLKVLRHLDVRGCERLQELVGLDELKALEKLKVSHCKELKNLPELSELQLLQEIYAEECEQLRELPGLERLESLRVLWITGSKELEALPNLTKLSKLERLEIVDCRKLREIQWMKGMDPEEIEKWALDSKKDDPLDETCSDDSSSEEEGHYMTMKEWSEVPDASVIYI